MGAMDENLGRGYEKPAHFVTITKGFYLGKFEVSQFEWMKIMTENPSNKFISEKNPVGSVTWNAANEFCRKLTDLERKAKIYWKVGTIPCQQKLNGNTHAGQVPTLNITLGKK